MVHKRLLRPERLRRVPSQFSWVDHRLVREHHIEHCDAHAWALYLFLVTVADAEGLSYYADASLGRRLGLDREQLACGRRDLIAADLIAYEAPLYQILSLDNVVPNQPVPRSDNQDRQATDSTRSAGPRHLGDILRGLGERR